jgi:signal transduction histidine kinase
VLNAPNETSRQFLLQSVESGLAAVQLVLDSLDAEQPIAMAIISVQSPGTWDAVTTHGEIWRVDPNIQAVLTTSSAGVTWENLFAKLGETDQLFVVQEPLADFELLQMAVALTRKWGLAQQNRRESQTMTGFLANVCHEIRTPMTAILGYADYLLEVRQHYSRAR